MTARQICVVVWLLLASAFCWAGTDASAELSAAGYRAELDRLLSATQQLNSSGSSTPQPLQELPQSWHVHTEQKEFEVSAQGLKEDVRVYDKEKNAANATAIRNRLQGLRNDLDGFENAPADSSAYRANLKSILARPEFRDVHGRTWLDRFKERIQLLLFHLLEKLFRSSAIPIISKFFVYGLMGLAVLALAYIVYRKFWNAEKILAVVPTDLPVSAKDWAIWLSEARAAADHLQWTDAIHLAYWAGISFLEGRGVWKPDRARTPREYLHLVSGSKEHRETLTIVTRIFELAWYAKREASQGTFSQMLQELEKLGCH